MGEWLEWRVKILGFVDGCFFFGGLGMKLNVGIVWICEVNK